ncbi:hypothetical protein [Ralstonia pseudosolanacearum]|uniref:hypothetical protein n=1 Tax=Ralstonia pseudosolanacearum TaxID=1310165 RepID=UPI003CF3ECF7
MKTLIAALCLTISGTSFAAEAGSSPVPTNDAAAQAVQLTAANVMLANQIGPQLDKLIETSQQILAVLTQIANQKVANQPLPVELAKSGKIGDKFVALRMFSPVAYDAVLQIEVNRGTIFTDEQLESVMASDEFATEFRKSLSRFCSIPENSANLACVPQKN